jgi:signal transduction histidine kinase
MPTEDSNRRRRRLAWRIAGFWMVVLALGLAAVGVVLAIQQARSLTSRLTAPAEAEARLIADKALSRFNEELPSALDAVAEHIRRYGGEPWTPPREFPGWVDGIFSWDGENLRVLAVAFDSSDELRALVQARLDARWKRPVGEAEPRIELLYDFIGASPVVLACTDSTGAEGQPVLIGAYIDIHRLKSDLVEPFLPADCGLELFRVQPGEPYGPWSQQLFSAMRFWGIRPTRAYVDEQTKTVVTQTVAYLGLTVLALCTLLAAMWVLGRVVGREIALAEMKANFVADVSHELKTPLSLIRMFAETLQSGRVVSDEKRQEYYGIIVRESTRLTNLINNILDFARIEAGRREYTLEPVAVEEVVRQTYEAYAAQLEQNRFEHHLTVESPLPPVDADRDAIAQAVINLIVNAIKYSGDERYLAIDVARDTRRGRHGVLISVHDRGIGIRPDDRGHVLEGFFRSSDGRVREQGGTGLGLALVKHIVDAHGGSLDVESRLVKGSTFRIFLPASQRQVMERQAPAVDKT